MSDWDHCDMALWREYCALVYNDTEPTPGHSYVRIDGSQPQAWRDLPPTEKQLDAISWDFKCPTKPATRGEASDLIAKLKQDNPYRPNRRPR